MNINDPGPHHGPGCFCVLCSRADALQAPLADHGISPAQLREKVEMMETRLHNALKRIEILEQRTASLRSVDVPQTPERNE